MLGAFIPDPSAARPELGSESTAVTPINDEAPTLSVLLDRLTHVLPGLTPKHEIVNDRSRDESLALSAERVGRDFRPKVLSFSYNSGHQVAITPPSVERAAP